MHLQSTAEIELRWGAGEVEWIKKFAKELVDQRTDAIFGVTTSVTGALTRETRTIPRSCSQSYPLRSAAASAQASRPGGDALPGRARSAKVRHEERSRMSRT
jgi:hypothetical protein